MSNTIIEILIDRSGSMGFMKGVPGEENNYLINGETRLSIVKKILLTEIIPTIDYASRIIIRTFRMKSVQKGDQEIETTVTPKVYDGVFNNSELQTKIKAMTNPPSGGTPITAAIEAAVKDLEKFENYDRKIILFTDGEENGGGDYKEAAKKALSLKGIPCKIFIVGLNQTDDDERKSKEIATGGYINIKTNSYNPIQVKSALAPLKTGVLQNSIQNVKTNSVVSPQKQSVSQQKIIHAVENKIDTIKKESQQAATTQLENLDGKIIEHISNSQKLLSELSSLKELFRVSSLLEAGIDSTTLTIDNEYSESIRQRSETFLYKLLCDKHGVANVKWLNEKIESGSHHDFELLNSDGKTIQLIECKGTPESKPTFYLTSYEWTHFLTNKEIYQLYRVFNVDGEMSAVCIDNLLASIVDRQVVPYLMKPEILKEGRVFLTLLI